MGTEEPLRFGTVAIDSFCLAGFLGPGEHVFTARTMR